MAPRSEIMVAGRNLAVSSKDVEMVTNLLLLLAALALMVIGAGVVLGVLLYIGLMVAVVGLLALSLILWLGWHWYRRRPEDSSAAGNQSVACDEGRP